MLEVIVKKKNQKVWTPVVRRKTTEVGWRNGPVVVRKSEVVEKLDPTDEMSE
jgi:hypothetical protein